MIKDKYKLISILTAIFSMVFIIFIAISFYEKTMAEIEMLKVQISVQRIKINSLETIVSDNKSKISILISKSSDNNHLIINNQKNISALKEDSSKYVLQSSFRSSMDIIHQDHQDTNKAISSIQRDSVTFQQHVSSEFSKVYRTILGSCG